MRTPGSCALVLCGLTACAPRGSVEQPGPRSTTTASSGASGRSALPAGGAEGAVSDAGMPDHTTSGAAVTDAAVGDVVAVARRAPRTPVFASHLEHGSGVAAGLAIDADWADEHPELDGLWPAGGCHAVSEAWLAEDGHTTIARRAGCAGAARALRSAHPIFADLQRTLAERVDAATAAGPLPRQSVSWTAEFETPSVRIQLRETRMCMYHGCAELSEPGTELFVASRQNPAEWFEQGYRRALTRVAATRPLVPMPAFPGVRRSIARFDALPLGRREVELVYAVDAAGQQAMQAWLMRARLGVPVPGVAGALDSRVPGLSFVFYPPGLPNASASISGHAEPSEPAPAD